ncbi:MAG: PEP-CTERM sorting domain-containing protein [Acidobacteria bacterium]|nr:PEP-CTERM sorting domain-containing protein [Acidobacteriota bacterium]MDA1236412.1 PEP-CTERM sorting domain-containing protein [Acidobacteriota bacterium]
MKKISQLLRAALLAGVAAAANLSAGTITTITIGDFTAPDVLDFESVATGNIAGNDAIFAAIGISSISGTASSYSDDFQDRDNSSDGALWFTSGDQLVVVDPGNSGGSIYGQGGISYTIDFAAAISRFGFSTHDEPFASQGAPPLVITFYSGVVPVGSTTSNGVLLPTTGPSPDWDRRDYFFHNTDSFDRIVLSTTGSDQGFALDNLTTEPAAGSELSDIPEPGSLALLGLGLLGLAAARRRRRS